MSIKKMHWSTKQRFLKNVSQFTQLGRMTFFSIEFKGRNNCSFSKYATVPLFLRKQPGSALEVNLAFP